MNMLFFYDVAMKRTFQAITTSAVFTFLAFVIITSPSFVLAATNLQFIGTPEITKVSDGGLVATATLKATGSTFAVLSLTSSGGSAVLQCNNPAGNNPASTQVPFGVLQGPKGALGANFTVAVKPNIFNVIVPLPHPPLPTASQICPNPNWSISLISITYRNVVLHFQQCSTCVDILTFNFGNVDPEVASAALVGKQ